MGFRYGCAMVPFLKLTDMARNIRFSIKVIRHKIFRYIEYAVIVIDRFPHNNC